MRQASCGFDLAISQSIKFRNTVHPHKRRDKRNPISWSEIMMMTIKMCLNVLSFNQKLHYDNQHDKKLMIAHIDNVRQASMNNVGAIDHAIRDWIDDSDYLLARICTEFPKVSSGYRSKFDIENRPWGGKRDPIYMDPYLDSNQVNLCQSTYEKGVWYYWNYPLTDHHDVAGVSSSFKTLTTMLGLEYRPTFWLNLYNRIRLLDFSELENNQFVFRQQVTEGKASRKVSELSGTQPILRSHSDIHLTHRSQSFDQTQVGGLVEQTFKLIRRQSMISERWIESL